MDINHYTNIKKLFMSEINELSKGKFTIIDFKLKLNEQSYWKQIIGLTKN